MPRKLHPFRWEDVALAALPRVKAFVLLQQRRRRRDRQRHIHPDLWKLSGIGLEVGCGQFFELGGSDELKTNLQRTEPADIPLHSFARNLATGEVRSEE